MRFWRTTNASPNRCEAVPDLYLYEDAPVLRNKLDIRDEKTLDLVEAEQSRQSMMILYKRVLTISLLRTYVRSIAFYLRMYMNGPASIGSST